MISAAITRLFPLQTRQAAVLPSMSTRRPATSSSTLPENAAQSPRPSWWPDQQQALGVRAPRRPSDFGSHAGRGILRKRLIAIEASHVPPVDLEPIGFKKRTAIRVEAALAASASGRRPGRCPAVGGSF
jgi:hypothetical protein